MKINKEQITAIHIIDERESNWYTYQKALTKKFLGITTYSQKEGFRGYMDDVYTKEELEKIGYLIKNNKVYEKPCVRVDLSDGKSYYKEFENNHSRDNYVNFTFTKSSLIKFP